MSRKKMSLAIITLFVIASMVLAACGAEPTATPVPTKAPPTATPVPAKPTEPPKPTVPPTATPVPLADKQVLRFVSGEPDTIDPQKASFVGEIEVIMRVFSNMMTFNKDGKLVPEMAEKYEVSPDGKTYKFTLRKGLTYSDGTPLTAKNFEYAWLRLADPATAGEYAFIAYDVVGFEEYQTADTTKLSKDELAKLKAAVGVKALDDLTLEIKLKNPAGYFLAINATWVSVPTREDMVTKGGDKWTEPATYIGNGPYIFKTWDHNSKKVFEANPKYFRGAPNIKTVEHIDINDAAVAFTAYKNGELDIYGVGAEDLPVVKADPQLSKEFIQIPGSCTFYVGMNTKKPPFDNVKVRQAFSYGLDRVGYVNNIQKVGIPAGQFLPPGFPGYYKDLKEQTYDPAKAKQLLAEAGYPDGKGLPEIKWTYSSSPRMKTRIEALSEIYKQSLGVTIIPDPVESKAYTALVKDDKTTPQMFFLGWCQDYPDPQDWYTIVFHSTSTITHVGWKNAKYDELTRKGDVETDPAKRDALYKEAAQILLDEAPVAFIYYSMTARLTKPWVSGFIHNPLEYFVGQYSMYDAKILKH